MPAPAVAEYALWSFRADAVSNPARLGGVVETTADPCDVSLVQAVFVGAALTRVSPAPTNTA